MDAQTTVISKVQQFASELKEAGINLRKVILFGSYARNEQHEHSDIDVTLVADEFIGVGFIDIGLFVDVLKNHILIQPKTYSTADFNEGDPFIDEITATGIEIKMD